MLQVLAAAVFLVEPPQLLLHLFKLLAQGAPVLTAFLIVLYWVANLVALAVPGLQALPPGLVSREGRQRDMALVVVVGRLYLPTTLAIAEALAERQTAV